MASQTLLLLLNRCITDKKFRTLLLRNPQEAVQNYDLPAVERQALMDITATDLVDLANKLADLGLISREDATRK